MKIDVIIGIDPGKSGGIAIYVNSSKTMKVVKMPDTTKKLSDYLNHVKETYGTALCFIEKVSSWTTDKNEGGKSFGIEKMMANYTQLKTVLTLCEIPFVQVHSRTWQGTLNLIKKGESKKDRKNRYKLAASTHYPNLKATLWNADAVCVMHFGRIKLSNDVNWVIDRLPPAAQKELI